MKQILVTPRSFAANSDEPIRLLEQAGYRVIRNPEGRILSETELIKLLKGCEGIIVGVDPLSEAVIEAACELKAIAKYGVGTDNIALKAAERRGIPVSVTEGANTQAVADYTFALMLAVARRIVPIHTACKNHNWTKQTALDVYGKMLGILGFGAIGKAVALRGRGFSMKVMAHDPVWDEDYAAQYGIQYAQPEDVYAKCDFISLHLPLTQDTKGMIGERQLEMMKPTAVLVNTSRGGTIDEDALIHALKAGRIYGAGLDVFESEPPEREALYHLDNLVMGSHTAASTQDAVANMSLFAAENILKSLE